MRVVVDVPVPEDGSGVPLVWEYGFEIVVESPGECVIRANKAGLVSLARILLTLASDEVQSGVHVHLDDGNSLEDGSAQLVIERM
jgi:hypothetical protein